MLSVILYGRNDSHGYNLHKRGALSLNAIAQVMNDPSDELIFVDYNTPDELPTFPEAIADTLTDQTKKVLRILRVRPGFHAERYAAKTRLVALEPQSRNIAIRRANPDNKWILSTNTDMIFCPADPAASLSSIVGCLDDGFYHLPRFEVPEGFWERLDRTDPDTAIAAMRQAGIRFHLNEIVYGFYDNLYEGPGDFQLFLRQDLFDIRGFDERMILGWHADSNMARRMRLLRGEVKTAFPLLHGYHCGHTRQATALHGGNRTENDMDLFVRNLTDPVAPGQDDWGAADYPIEEVRLDRDDHYFPAMAAATPNEGPPFSEATYNDTTKNRVTYDAGHVLPHLCDILFNLPAGQTVFFFGDDIALLEGLKAFLDEAGRAPRFILSDVAGCPDLKALDPARWGDTVTPLAQGLETADLFILQYPKGDIEPERRNVESWWHHQLLTALRDMDGRKPKARRRRIVVVNGIHSDLNNVMESVLAPSVMPFSARIRQGFVVDALPGPPVTDIPEWPVYRKLGRARPFTASDRDLLDRALDGLRQGKPVAGWERLAPEIASICTSPDAARDTFGVGADEARDWARKADLAMRQVLANMVEHPVVVGPRSGVSNRLCSGADWNDPDWALLGFTYFDQPTASLMDRSRWMWERMAALVTVWRTVPTVIGGAASAPRLLLICEGPDMLAPILTHMGFDVTYTTSAELLAGRCETDWSQQLDLRWLNLPRPMTPLDVTANPAPFDVMMAAKPSLFEQSSEKQETMLAAIDPMMAQGALMVCATTVQINDKAYEGGFSFAEWKDLYGPEGPLGARGFTPVGDVDPRAPIDSAVCLAAQDDMQDTIPGLSYGYVNSYSMPCLVTARWPDVLKPGPAERRPWTEGAIDPWQTFIPYGADAAPGARAGDDEAPTRRVDLIARAYEAIDTIAVPVDAKARNLLPFVLSDTAERVRPTELALTAEDAEAGLGPWLALCLDAGDARRLVIEPQTNGAYLCEVKAIVHGNGLTSAQIEVGRVVLDRDGRFGKVSVAMRLAGGDAVISQLKVWAEA